MCKPFREAGLNARTVNIMASSWRQSTKKQYVTYINKWKTFCCKKSISYLYSDVQCILEFFSDLYHDEGAGYSVINLARSALSAFVILKDTTFSVGTHPFIQRFMKGVFHLRPPKPRYMETWDVNIVFNYLRTWSPANALDLKRLTLKLCMIIALISAQRIQSLHYLNLEGIILRDNAVTFHFKDLLKQSKPGNHSASMKLKAYPQDRRLCVVKYLREYISRTHSIRAKEQYLFISHKKPYRRVTTQTIARWIKEVMEAAGIDTQIYKAHSTRAASTSAADKSNFPVSHILAQAGWTNERTFRKYYNKPCPSEKTYTEAIIKSSLS